MKVTLTFEKETKNTVKYTELGKPEGHSIGSLYLKKAKTENTPLQGVKVINIEVLPGDK